MSDRFVIVGGQRLAGEVCLPGAKNAALPILAASLLAGAPVTILDFPVLTDTELMLELLERLGCRISRSKGSAWVDSADASSWVLPEEITSRMRASVFMLGPLLARFGRAEMTQPGGCQIGKRPVDYHLQALEEMGTQVVTTPDGHIDCRADRLCGCDLRLPYPSVGATENLMMAAVLAEGTTVIENAAREPEVMDLQAFLNELGGQVSGGGTSTLVIQGVPRLYGTSHRVIPDRIVAGSLLAAAAATRGEVTLTHANPSHLWEPLRALRHAGCYIEVYGDRLSLRADTLRSLGHIRTGPFPAFPTDLQASFCAAACTARGITQVEETVFENRFHHLSELEKMGAEIAVHEDTAWITGTPFLHGTEVTAQDLRGGMALVTAALAAEGETTVYGASHIDRGYQTLDNVLCSLGASILRMQ